MACDALGPRRKDALGRAYASVDDGAARADCDEVNSACRRTERVSGALALRCNRKAQSEPYG